MSGPPPISARYARDEATKRQKTTCLRAFLLWVRDLRVLREMEPTARPGQPVYLSVRAAEHAGWSNARDHPQLLHAHLKQLRRARTQSLLVKLTLLAFPKLHAAELYTSPSVISLNIDDSLLLLHF